MTEERVRPSDQRPTLLDPAYAGEMIAPFSPFMVAAGTLIAERYQVEREIGTGAMGVVYEARDLRLGRKVAVKLMTARSSDARARFEREARSAARVDHPNLVKVFDHGEQDGVPYLVMELLRGETLRKLATRGRLPVTDALRLVKITAAAMAAAHRDGLVHRDLKPDNIFLDGEGAQQRLVIVDFGLAFATSGDLEMMGRLTAAGRTCGTPDYMSPEQCTASEITAATDVYALGCILYELLAGAPPFSGQATRVMTAQVYTSPTPLSARRADLSPSLLMLLEHMLDKAPEHRPTMHAVHVRLSIESGEPPPSTGPMLEPVRSTRAVTLPERAAAPPPKAIALGTVLIVGDRATATLASAPPSSPESDDDELVLALAVSGIRATINPAEPHDAVLLLDAPALSTLVTEKPVVVVGPAGGFDVALLIRAGATDVVARPFEISEVAAKLARVLRGRARARRNSAAP